MQTTETRSFLDCPVSEWTTSDFQKFYERAEEIAADGDLATIRPELREMALQVVARKEGRK